MSPTGVRRPYARPQVRVVRIRAEETLMVCTKTGVGDFCIKPKQS